MWGVLAFLKPYVCVRVYVLVRIASPSSPWSLILYNVGAVCSQRNYSHEKTFNAKSQVVSVRKILQILHHCGSLSCLFSERIGISLCRISSYIDYIQLFCTSRVVMKDMICRISELKCIKNFDGINSCVFPNVLREIFTRGIGAFHVFAYRYWESQWSRHHVNQF